MLAVCGFNGFGQFDCDLKKRICEFNVFTVNDLTVDNRKLLIAPSWSYTVFARNKTLLLKGFISNQSNSSYTITTDDVIKQISACDRFCLVLTENGKLYKLQIKGNAILQEIKLESSNFQHLPPKRTIFGEPKSEKSEFHCTQICCGNNISAAVCNLNGVYSIPSKIHQFPKHFRIQQLLCGFEHALLLSGNGDVYSWGNGLRGQLGQDVLRIEETPILIEALAGIKITFVAASGWHSAAISAFGDLYTWGFNSNGQLGLRVYKPNSIGLKEPTVYPLPQLIDLPHCCIVEAEGDEKAETDAEFNCSPIKVYAGARHTILHMSCGVVYATGLNTHGQLGLEDKHEDKHEFFDEFKKLSKLPMKNTNDCEIICGPWCTIISKFEEL